MTKILKKQYMADYGWCVVEKELNDQGKVLAVQVLFVTDGTSDNHEWYCDQVVKIIEGIRNEQ